MAGRRLSPEEHHLWVKVAQSVRPLPGKAVPVAPEPKGASVPRTMPTSHHGGITAVQAPSSVRGARRPADVLDSSWERRIARGILRPDIAIDLHGHTLDAARARLDTALGDAVRGGARIVLVVTGKPRGGPVASVAGERARGAIRAEIGHWLALSPYADRLASVRTAHPRHGGAGALYLILRK